MKIFYKDNNKFIWLVIFINIALWTYANISTMILSKYYNYSDIELSYMTSAFVISYLFGISLYNLKLEGKLSYIKEIKNKVLLYIVVMFLNIVVIIFNVDHMYMIVLRLFEGYAGGGLTALTLFIRKSILMKTSKDGILNSLGESFLYIIKAGVPIIITALFIIDGYEYIIYVLAILMYLYVYFYIHINREVFKYRYQLIMRRSQNGVKKQSIIKTFKGLSSFFKEDTKMRIHLAITLALGNYTRPFYDLYMVLLLINVYDFSLLLSTTYLSAMVFGQASQIIPGYLSDRWDLYKVRALGLVIYTIPFLLIGTYPDLLKNEYIGILIFYIFGIGRSFYEGYSYKLQINLAKNGAKLSQVEFLVQFIAAGSNYLSYLILGYILYLGATIPEIYNYVYYGIGISVLILVFFDRKYLNRKF